MKQLPIPEDVQILAMIQGSLLDVLKEYVENPICVEFKRFITIDRQDIIKYLILHPKMATCYFREKSGITTLHDVQRIWKEGSEYLTAWFDHGRPSGVVNRFKTLSEAIAEHVLVAHGLY